MRSWLAAALAALMLLLPAPQVRAQPIVPEPESEPEPGSEPGPGPDLEPESEPEPGSEPKPESVPEPGSEPESEPKPEPELEPKPEPEPGPAPSWAPDRDGEGRRRRDDRADLPERPPIDFSAPPINWNEFSVEFVNGKRFESAAIVHAFLEPRMTKQYSPLGPSHQQDLSDFCLQELGYHLVGIREEKMPEGGILVVLRLEAVTLVYWVDVDISNINWAWNAEKLAKSFFDAIFSDEIRRRLRLRPGSPMPRDKRARRRRLRQEKRRLAEFLRNEGFFDASVKIAEKRRNANSVEIKIKVDKGRRYDVGRIEVVGNHAVETSTIVGKFRHPWFCVLTKLTCFLKRGFTRQQLRKDVESVTRLYRRRGYPGVRVRTDFDVRHSFKRETGTVEFTVFINERRKIDVVFEGNNRRRFPDHELKEVLTFAEEGSYDDVEVQASAEAVRSHYQTKGHFEANVSWERERFGGVFERILFSIDEGPRLKVVNVSFEGNKAISNGALASVVKTKVFGNFKLFPGRGGYTTSLQLRQDVNRIAALYDRKGFHKAKVRARVARDPRVKGNAAALAAAIAGEVEAKGLYVRFLIDEGPQLVVEGVQFEFARDEEMKKRLPVGEPHRKRKELGRVVALKKGKPYHEDQADKDAARLERHYYKHGYPYAVVKHYLRKGSADNRVIVVHSIFESHEVRFGKLVIRGNFKTRDWVIRDELGYYEGHRLTLGRAERGQQNLRSAGLFKAVNVEFVDFEKKELDLDQETVNVVVRVQERESNSWEVSGGWSTDRGLILEGKHGRSNMGGTGMGMDILAQFGTETYDFESDTVSSPDYLAGELKLTAPRWIARRATRGIAKHLLGMDSPGGWAFATETAGFYRLETTERFGKLESYGGSLAFSKAGHYGFFQGWLFSLRYDWRHRSYKEELVRTAGASSDIKQDDVPITTGSIGPVLVIDKRTDQQGRPQPLAPDRGFKLEFRAKLADRLLLADDRFVKLGASLQNFWRPFGWRRALFTNGFRYDHGIPLGGEFLLPEVERYFAGGDTSVRGFEEDRLATEVITESLPPLGNVNQITVIPAGGNIRVIHNLDFQLQVWDMWSIPVVSAVFVDTGLITNSLDQYRFWTKAGRKAYRNFRHALGVAFFRLAAPFGSVSLEYAIPLDPKLGDDPRGRFHFNIGLLF